MANEIVNAFLSTFRDFVTDGVSSSGKNKTKKSDARAIGSVIQTQFDAVKAIATSGTHPVTAARVAATTSMTLSTVVSGATIDETVVAVGDRVVLPVNTNAATNGVYVVQPSGPAVRASDADTGAELLGLNIYITEGTINGGKSFACAAPGPITVNTTLLPFVQTGGNAGTAALQEEIDAHIDDQTNPHNVTWDQTGIGNYFPVSLSANWIHADEDDIGFVIAGTAEDGTAYPPPNTFSLSADWGDADEDQNGYVMAGLRDDGSAYPDAIGAVDAMIYRDDDRVWVASGGYAAPITDDGDFLDADIVGTEARYLQRSGGAVTKKTVGLSFASTMLSTVLKLSMIPVLGQSVSAGIATSPAALTDIVRSGRALMYNAGIRSLGNSHSSAYLSTVLDPSNIRDLVDMQEVAVAGAGETGWAQMARVLTDIGTAYPATTALLMSAHGISGQSYTVLKKGTTPYNNLLAAVYRGKLLATLQNCDFEVPMVAWVQGEADRLVSQATYYGYLIELQADLDADIKKITGQTATVRLILDQIASWTSDGVTTRSEVPIAQMQAFKNFPGKFILVGPKYQYQYGPDGLHPLSASYRNQGEYFGRAARPYLSGGTWSPLQVDTAIRTGTTIELTFKGGSGNLVKDVTNVTDPGNGGIVFTQTGGTAKTLSGLTVTGANKATISISAIPDGTSPALELGLNGTAGAAAGWNSGPRICLRDSSPDISVDGTTHLYNWCCPDRIAIT